MPLTQSEYFSERPTIAIGPIMPGWGSWDWVGADNAVELAKYYRVVTFRVGEQPNCDVLLLIEHPAFASVASRRGKQPAVVFCPIDFYGSQDEIDADASLLRRCSRILIHAERLRRYFEPYASVEYMDHHVKFIAPIRTDFKSTGELLWVGVRTNLEPLVGWVNRHPLPAPLRVLTNLEAPQAIPTPTQLGFRTNISITVEHWTPDRHLALAAEARAAIDIKGADFRSRHKPPAKAIDFIASGIPLAMNAESPATDHLARLGFQVASPLDPDRWLSEAYWQDTQRFGAALRELLSLERISLRFRKILDEVLAERR